MTDTVDGFEDWSFEHFAELALSNDMSGETKMEFREVSRDKRQIFGKET